MIRDVIANWSFIFFSAIGAFVLYPFFVDVLGEEQYGVWLLISSITGYFTLLQLGLPPANVRFISAHWARGEFQELNNVLRSNLAFFCGIDVVVLALGGTLALFFGRVFEVPPALLGVARIALLVASVEVALRFLGTLFEGVLHARREFVVLNVIVNTALLGRVGAIFLFVRADNGVVVIASILVGVTVFQLAAFILYVRRKFPEISLSEGRFHRSTLRKVFGYSFQVLLLDVSTRLSFSADALVIGAFLSVADIVPFGIANNILTYFMMFSIGFSSALMPRVSAADATGNRGEIGAQYTRYSRLMAFVSVPICLSLWRFGDDFIALWMGENYRGPSGEVLTILALGYAFFLVQRGVAFPILMGMSEMSFAAKLMFGAAAANILLSVWWAGPYGLSGVAWGTTLPLLVLTPLLAAHVCRVLDISTSRYLLQTMALPALSGVSFLAAAAGVERSISASSAVGFLCSVTLCLGVYAVVTYALFLTSEDRLLITGLLRSRLQKQP